MKSGDVEPAILSFVATVNEDGTPNISSKASLTVMNGVLYLADIASPRTTLNLKRNPTVEINVVDIFQRRAYRFKGRALILPPNDGESLMIANWIRATNGPEYPVDHFVKIETTSITTLRSPAHVFATLVEVMTKSGAPTFKSTVCETHRGIGAASAKNLNL